MGFGRALLLCVFISSAFARRSPHANHVLEYFNGPNGSRFSNDLYEDALLDVPGLITKYGYPVEVHDVITEDGYILEMQRIPHGRDRNNIPDPNKPAVVVMHGILCSAADWVLTGPGSALAYELAEAGYDVWLGNARGTYYSRRHITLNPDRGNDFWKFSWDEIGRLDLPAMFDYIREKTGKARLHYIGHSQGTTVFWAMASLRPEYNKRIISMQALAPVAFMEHNETPLFIMLGPIAGSIESLGAIVGVTELFPNTDLMTWLGQTFCADGIPTQSVCSELLFWIAGYNPAQHNATIFPLLMGHTPAGAAVRQLVHYGQHIRKNFFRRYDHGALSNWREYRRFTPPSYDLSRITAPVFLHYVDHDIFAHVRDVQKLFRELGRPVGMFRVPDATFSHQDFMWGIDAKTLVYDRVINMMKSVGDV